MEGEAQSSEQIRLRFGVALLNGVGAMNLSRDSRRWWLALRLVPQMNRVRFYTLIDHFQTPEAVLGASATEIASLRGFNEELARAVLEAPRSPACDLELEEMHRRGVRLLTLEDEEYPENLRRSSFPPPLLYVRGRIEPMDRFAIAVIGSRRATPVSYTHLTLPT
ncbi:MAG: DNA-processing protein DprA, partial [Candidatus Sumerlaeaceae bacterium]|nr:DNA-processing protein DprA [Candidatus Sumerlaeaceae bacterium]